VAKIRGDDEFYSLAFDKKEQGEVKVITNNGNNEVVAKMYQPSHSSQAQWKFAPVEGQRNKYQIISVTSNQALAMKQVQGKDEFQIRLVKPDQQDVNQQWQIEDAETGEVLSDQNDSNQNSNNDNDF